jgi:hypothetical protein
LRRVRIIVVLLAMLASALLGYSYNQQNLSAYFVLAPPKVEPPPAEADGCGSRGGPGYRLPSGKCASWSSQQNPPAPIVSAPPVPLISTPPAVRPSSQAASGCGSRGGPGYRLPSGKCASWTHQRHSPKRSQKN